MFIINMTQVARVKRDVVMTEQAIEEQLGNPLLSLS